MPKCFLFTKFLQLKLLKFLIAILCISALTQSLVHIFSQTGYFYYSHIQTEDIDKVLLKKVNPNLVVSVKKPKCDYNILKSKRSIVVPGNFNDFLPVGVMNGSYIPEHCTPEFSVAVLVTYRNRQSQLDIFIPYIHNFLRKQHIHYKIYVIEQQDDKPWNKGALYNIGAKIAISEKFPCLILHDVDLLPLDESNLYTCLKHPRHMSASIDKLRYVLPYTKLVGGALAIQADQYKQVNGFSNRFIGWGGEDDNFYDRLYHHNLQVLRFPREMSRYKMLSHHKQKRNGERFERMKDNLKIFQDDGINSVRYLHYQVQKHRLFTLIQVRL